MGIWGKFRKWESRNQWDEDESVKPPDQRPINDQYEVFRFFYALHECKYNLEPIRSMRITSNGDLFLFPFHKRRAEEKRRLIGD